MRPEAGRRIPRWAAGAVAVVLLFAPIGRYAPYPRTVQRMTEVVRACATLPPGAVAHRVHAPILAAPRLLPRPHADIEDIVPSVSRSSCTYRVSHVCRDPVPLRRLVLTVIVLRTGDLAMMRYKYARTFLDQDSRRGNAFHDIRLRGRRAYLVTIGHDVLLRVLDGRFVADLHFTLCKRLGGERAQRIVRPIAADLRLPIAAFSVPTGHRPRLAARAGAALRSTSP